MEQIIAIDSCIFIYLFEQHKTFGSKSRLYLKNIQSGNLKGIFSAIGLMEIMTGVKKYQQEYNLIYRVKHYIENFQNLSIVYPTADIVDKASTLRAIYNMSSPDAIHLASAIVYGADVFITNDKALKKVKEIKVELL